MRFQGLAEPPTTAPRISPTRVIGLIGATLALAYVVVLSGSYFTGDWLVNAQGQPIAGDFVNVWAAGRLTLDGHSAAAYDWTQHKAMEAQAVGHTFDDYYGWHYPPPFLFVAAALALMPFLPASIIWLATTLPLYVAALRAIVGERVGILLALGFPGAVWGVTAGQNGFLTAALIGGTLGLLERHPTFAGIFLGLLTYKPQFGLLFPLVLVIDRKWRVVVIASAVALGMAAISWFAFGSAAWQAFFHWMPITSHVVLGEGGADWHRLQSLFGFVRAHGGSEPLAWAMQATAALALAASLCRLWRSRVPYELKGAALATATLLATPYLYIYDLVVLAVPVAFLLRLALARGFLVSEIFGLAAGGILLLIYPYVATHVGFAATLIVGVLILQRIKVETIAR